jgi:hypothetical protein
MAGYQKNKVSHGIKTIEFLNEFVANFVAVK